MTKRLLPFFKILFSSALIYALYCKIPLRDMRNLLVDADLYWFLLVVLLLASNVVISALKWKLFLDADNIVIPLKTLTATYLIGSFYNMFLPSNIGGDSYRIVDVAKRSKQPAKTAISVLADRLSGLIAMLLLGSVSALFFAPKLDNPVLSLLPILLLCTLVAGVALLFYPKLFHKLLASTQLDRISVVFKMATKLLESVEAYRAKPTILFQTLAISFIFQFCFCSIVYCLAKVVHAETDFIYFCIFIPLITLLEMLPISINGIGLRDAGYVFFFGNIGMGDLQTRSIALLLFVTISFCSLCGGVIYLFRIVKNKDN